MSANELRSATPQRIYIAGPMRGLTENNHPAFNAAAKHLREKGWTVENPVEIASKFYSPGEIEGDSDKLRNLMRIERAVVKSCDAIYLLRGWEKSDGARRELDVAIFWDLRIILQK